jgi:D-lactate dehydrogenase
MHREIFDITKKYGKDTVMMINYLGTDRLPMFFALKGAIDARLNKLKFLPKNLTDHFMQVVSGLWPEILPKSILKWRNNYEHHLILKMHGKGIDEARNFLKKFFKENTGDYFECSPKEAKIAALHRFAAAGAPIRYQAIHHKDVEDILALDIALKRNEKNWLEVLPKEISDHLLHKFYYGHFMCHVLHQDYVVKKGEDVKTIKTKMLEILNERGVEYPAEHNVGHIYNAKPDLVNFYKSIDPTNSLNPGLGKTSKAKNYAETP